MKNAQQTDHYKRAFRLAVRHYLHEVRTHWRTSVPSLLLPALNTILISYVPPLAVAAIVSRALSGEPSSFQTYIPYVILFGMSWLIGEVVMRIGIWCINETDASAMKHLYTNGLAQLLKQDLSFFHDNFAGSLTKKTIGYAARFEVVFDTFSLNVFNKLLPIIFASIVLSFYSPLLTICLVSLLTISIAVAVPFIRKRRKLVVTREIASNVMSGHIADVYGNIDAVRAHASESYENKRHETLVKDYIKKARKTWDYQNMRVDLVLAPFFITINAIGLLISVYLAQNGTIEFSSLIVIFSYYLAVTSFMWEFNSIYNRLESSLSEAAQYTELLLTEPTIYDHKSQQHVEKPKGAITFTNVHFSYEQDSTQLFTDFSLSIPAGQKIGLVGRSGGGKTSITKLLLRFAEIDQGSIQIDGVDIRDLSQVELRELIGYVQQDPAMFHRSIHDNIAYARPDVSRETVIAAAKKAHAHEFIESLPNGYDTLVGERGVKLSGGQRQRVAIARAILKDAPILLLDEATSALDSESELFIQDALRMLMEHKTALVIAHRLSTIQKMDRIIVLDKGTIIEEGSHKDLLKKNGTYAKLWTHQSGGFIEE